MIEMRECGSCGTVFDHMVSDDRVVCLSCGTVGESTELGDCEIGECPRDATHLIVFNPVRSEERTEIYCEDHADVAADEALDDPAGELYIGPTPIDKREIG